MSIRDDFDKISTATASSSELIDEQRLTEEEYAALIAWAQDRIRAGALSNDIKDLVVAKIGILTRAQAQYLNRQRTFIPFGVTPSVLIDERVERMKVPVEEQKGLTAVDIYDPAEAKMLIWALEDIKIWLLDLEDGTRRYPHLLKIYESALRDARDSYTIIASHPPLAAKAVTMILRLEKAKKYVKEWESLH